MVVPGSHREYHVWSRCHSVLGEGKALSVTLWWLARDHVNRVQLRERPMNPLGVPDRLARRKETIPGCVFALQFPLSQRLPCFL